MIVTYTFKRQDNAEIKSSCLKNDCKLVIVPHNLTKKFQPLDICINQKANKFISHTFNTWDAYRISEQLKKGVAPGDVKVSMKMSNLKLLHARWIADMYTYLKQQKESILNWIWQSWHNRLPSQQMEYSQRLKTLSFRNERMKCKCRFA